MGSSNTVALPPIPEGFTLKSSNLPPIPEGFKLASPGTREGQAKTSPDILAAASRQAELKAARKEGYIQPPQAKLVPAPKPTEQPQILAEEPPHPPALINLGISGKVPESMKVSPPQKMPTFQEWKEFATTPPEAVEGVVKDLNNVMVGPFQMIQKGIIEPSTFMATPLGLAVGAASGGLGAAMGSTSARTASAASLAHAGVSGLFALQMIHNAIVQVPEAYNLAQQGEYWDALWTAGSSAISLMLGYVTSQDAKQQYGHAVDLARMQSFLQEMLNAKVAQEKGTAPTPAPPQQIEAPKAEAAPTAAPPGAAPPEAPSATPTREGGEAVAPKPEAQPAQKGQVIQPAISPTPAAGKAAGGAVAPQPARGPYKAGDVILRDEQKYEVVSEGTDPKTGAPTTTYRFTNKQGVVNPKLQTLPTAAFESLASKGQKLVPPAAAVAAPPKSKPAKAAKPTAPPKAEVAPPPAAAPSAPPKAKPAESVSRQAPPAAPITAARAEDEIPFETAKTAKPPKKAAPAPTPAPPFNIEKTKEYERVQSAVAEVLNADITRLTEDRAKGLMKSLEERTNETVNLAKKNNVPLPENFDASVAKAKSLIEKRLAGIEQFKAIEARRKESQRKRLEEIRNKAAEKKAAAAAAVTKPAENIPENIPPKEAAPTVAPPAPPEAAKTEIPPESKDYRDNLVRLGTQVRDERKPISEEELSALKPEDAEAFRKLMKDYLRPERKIETPPLKTAAKAGDFERVDGTFSNLDENDEFYYHVTTADRAKQIMKSGELTPGKARSMAEGFYANYSKGKIFFSERDGVSYWQEKIQEHLESQSERTPKLVVLRFPKSIVDKSIADEIGVKDSGRPSFYSETGIGRKPVTATVPPAAGATPETEPPKAVEAAKAEEPKPAPVAEAPAVQRKTPALKTPEREKLDSDYEARKKESEALWEQVTNLERERNAAKAYSKKREALDSKIQKLKDKRDKVDAAYEPLRQQNYRAELEDAASQTENPIARMVAERKLEEMRLQDETKAGRFNDKEAIKFQSGWKAAHQAVVDELRKKVADVDAREDLYETTKKQVAALSPEENNRAIEDALDRMARDFIEHPLLATDDIGKRLGGFLYGSRNRVIAEKSKAYGEAKLNEIEARYMKATGAAPPKSWEFADARRKVEEAASIEAADKALERITALTDGLIEQKRLEEEGRKKAAAEFSSSIRPLSEMRSPAITETDAWKGNFTEGDLAFDGKNLIDTNAIKDKSRVESLKAPSKTEFEKYPKESAEKAWNSIKKAATTKLEEIGHAEQKGIDYAVYAMPDDTAIILSAKQVRLIKSLTGFDEARGSGVDKPVVFYKKGNAVAATMPYKNAVSVDIPVAREAVKELKTTPPPGAEAPVAAEAAAPPQAAKEAQAGTTPPPGGSVTLGGGLGAMEPYLEKGAEAAKQYLAPTFSFFGDKVDAAKENLRYIRDLMSPKHGASFNALYSILNRNGTLKEMNWLLQEQGKRYSKLFEWLPRRQGVEFVDAVHEKRAPRGTINGKDISPALQEAGEFYRGVDDDLWDELSGYANVNYLEGHHRVFWKRGKLPTYRTEEVQRAGGFSGVTRANIRGSRGMLEHRFFKTMSEGLRWEFDTLDADTIHKAMRQHGVSPNDYKVATGGEEGAETVSVTPYSDKAIAALERLEKRGNVPLKRGGTPTYWNPDTMFQAAYADAMKYITAQRLWNENIENNLLRFVRKGASVPKGFDRIEDSISKVYAPVKTASFLKQIEKMVAEGTAKDNNDAMQQILDKYKEMGIELKMGQVIIPAGEWYGEQHFARLLNRINSPDQIRKYKVGRGLVGIKNAYTGIELGWSPFHFTFESIETMGSMLGIVFRELQMAWGKPAFEYRRGGLEKGKRMLLQAFKDAVNVVPSAIPGLRIGKFDASPIVREFSIEQLGASGKAFYTKSGPSYIKLQSLNKEREAAVNRLATMRPGNPGIGPAAEDLGRIDTAIQAEQGNYDQAVKEFMGTSTGKRFLERYPDAAELIHDWLMAGGNPHTDERARIKAVENFRTGVKTALAHDELGSAALKAPLALTEEVMSVLFETYIPNVKLGLFLREYTLAQIEYEHKLAATEAASNNVARLRYEMNDLTKQRNSIIVPKEIKTPKQQAMKQKKADLDTKIRDRAIDLQKAISNHESLKNKRGYTKEELASRIVQFIDDRFGEMNFDNLFWDNTMKTGLQLTFRSVTWKLGNIEGFEKGVAGVGRTTSDMYKALPGLATGMGEAPPLDMALAWMVGVIAIAAVTSTIINHFFGKIPMRDIAKRLAGGEISLLAYPFVDELGSRVRNPSYLVDWVHAKRDPWGYLNSSYSGDIGKVADVGRNKRFTGEEVYHRGDSPFKQVWDAATYMFPIPFSIQSYQRSAQQGLSPSAKYMGFLGFTKAPADIEDTPAVRTAKEASARTLPVGARTTQEFEHSRLKNRLTNQLKRGINILPETEQLYNQRVLSDKDVNDIVRWYSTPTLSRALERVTDPDALLDVWDKASQQEKDEIRDPVVKKLNSSFRNHPEVWTDRLKNRYLKAGVDLVPPTAVPPTVRVPAGTNAY